MQISPRPENSRRNTPLQFGVNLRKEPDQSELAKLTGAQYQAMVREMIGLSKGEEGYKTVLQLILEGEETKKLTSEEALGLRGEALKIDRKGLISWGQFPPTKQ